MIQILLKWFASIVLGFINPRRPKGKQFYEAIARHSVSVAIETVCLRTDQQGRVWVWLTRRKPDEVYSGQWHSPGSIVRPGESPGHVFERIATNELGCPITRAVWIPTAPMFYQEVRGWFHHHIFLVDLAGEPRGGTWWPAPELPDDLVAQHRAVIAQATTAFEARGHKVA